MMSLEDSSDSFNGGEIYYSGEDVLIKKINLTYYYMENNDKQIIWTHGNEFNGKSMSIIEHLSNNPSTGNTGAKELLEDFSIDENQLFVDIEIVDANNQKQLITIPLIRN